MKSYSNNNKTHNIFILISWLIAKHPHVYVCKLWIWLQYAKCISCLFSMFFIKYMHFYDHVTFSKNTRSCIKHPTPKYEYKILVILYTLLTIHIKCIIIFTSRKHNLYIFHFIFYFKIASKQNHKIINQYMIS